MTTTTVREHTRRKPDRLARDPFKDEIQARIAAKRGASKQEPVRASSHAASALHALAAHIRAGMSVVANVVREVR